MKQFWFDKKCTSMTSIFPVISIILPFHNAEKTLAAAIRSVLNQTFVDWELILIDDCSADASVDIAGIFLNSRVRLLKNLSNVGLAASLNIGIRAASAPYIARMDADDISYPDRLATQLAFLQAHPEVDIVGASVLMFIGDGSPVKLLKPALRGVEIKRGWISGSFPLYHPTWVAKSSWFREFPYDPRFLKAQDHELLLRACRSSTYANTPETLLGYRYDNGNLRKRLLTRRYVFLAQTKILLMRGNLFKFFCAAAITLAKCFSDLLIWRSASRAVRFSEDSDISGTVRARWQSVYRAVNL